MVYGAMKGLVNWEYAASRNGYAEQTHNVWSDVDTLVTSDV